MGEDGGRGRGRGRKKADGGGGRGKRRGTKKAEDLLGEPTVASDGPSIAFFDYCGEGHLRTLDLISSLYSREDEEGGLEDEIKRFSSLVTFVRGWKQFCNYKPQGIRFSHDVGTPGRSDLRYTFELSQFSAASILKVESEPSKSKPTKACDGFVLQVGGPVWALDWCYGTQLAHESGISCEYLAVAAHPSDSPFHKIGTALSGPGFVQIWLLLSVISKQDSFSSSHEARLKRRPDGRKSAREDTNGNVSISSTIGKAAGADLNGIQGNVGGLAVNMIADETESLSTQKLGLIPAKKKRKLKDQARTGSSCADPLSPSVHLGDSKSLLHGDSSPSIDALKELALPKFVLSLVHDGRVALDVKWKPCSKQGNCCRMGFLAVVLGDGSIQVWEIPTPRIIKALFVSGHIKDTDPRFMKLKPVFKCSKLLRGDSQSIPLTLEWSRAVPNDLLLVGCHDGTVAMWKFLPKESCEDTRPLLCFAADTLPIRAISWAPNERDANCENLVATAGHSGNIRFWDIRDPFRPLWDIHLSRGFILSMDWVHNPSSVIFSMDDGTLRILSLLKAASDVPVTGRPFSGKPCQGLQTYYCSSHAVWSVQVWLPTVAPMVLSSIFRYLSACFLSFAKVISMNVKSGISFDLTSAAFWSFANKIYSCWRQVKILA
ncbi:uncharacterized protein LOC116246208 isoform X2 [Nymphaea colorata]|uniref:uncharacterized protein LOC116246208 isoform X2 n=1 Tax=Nymphaea colorata TaxID=210225 RepID=UPI00214F12C0|nr:uncharacterized protein LOC116246208 isoform X2 [Nymphaea colorata]